MRLSVEEAKAHCSALISAAAQGEAVEITRRGVPVARMVRAACGSAGGAFDLETFLRPGSGLRSCGRHGCRWWRWRWLISPWPHACASTRPRHFGPAMPSMWLSACGSAAGWPASISPSAERAPITACEWSGCRSSAERYGTALLRTSIQRLRSVRMSADRSGKWRTASRERHCRARSTAPTWA